MDVLVCDCGGVDAEEKVVADGALEESWFLRHECYVFAVGVYVESGDGGVVEEDGPGLNVIEPSEGVNISGRTRNFLGGLGKEITSTYLSSRLTMDVFPQPVLLSMNNSQAIEQSVSPRKVFHTRRTNQSGELSFFNLATNSVSPRTRK